MYWGFLGVWCNELWDAGYFVKIAYGEGLLQSEVTIAQFVWNHGMLLTCFKKLKENDVVKVI
jgi:hypothetical protein